MMVIRVVKKKQFRVVIRVVKRGQFRVVIRVVKRGQFRVVFRVVKKRRLLLFCLKCLLSPSLPTPAIDTRNH